MFIKIVLNQNKWIKKNILKFFFDFIIFSYMIFECFAYNDEVLYCFQRRNFTHFIEFIDDIFEIRNIDKLFEK